MSTRQKSFFDQVHTTKARSHWRRNYSANDARQETTHVPFHKSAEATTPLAVSTQSKSKLKAFEFSATVDSNGGSSKMADEDQHGNENRDVAGKQAVEDSDTSLKARPLQAPSTQPSDPTATRDHPHTPASRIPLSDLIGNFEDTASRTKQDFTPEERVFWGRTRSPLSSGSNISQATPSLAGKKRAKRARSSSPMSSPHKSLHSVGSRAKTVDLQNFQNALTTAQVDPAAELWNRYATDVGQRPASDAAHLPMFANLLTASSPRTHLNDLISRNGATLRRSISCGTEWPASKAKRRKLTGTDTQQCDDDLFIKPNEKQPQDLGTSKVARVSVLLGKIQESLVKPRRKEDTDQSSSSPLPRTSNQPCQLKKLSAQAQPCEQAQNLEDDSLRHKDQAIVAANTATQRSVHLDNSSEFGDFEEADLDMPMVETGEESKAIASRKVLEDDADDIFIEALESQTGSLNMGTQAHKKQPASVFQEATVQRDNSSVGGDHDEDFDEFEDDDNAVFAADMEGVLAKYDTQTTSGLDSQGIGTSARLVGSDSSTCPSEKVSHGLINEDSVGFAEPCSASDDEFGDCDDIDFDLAAGEAIITPRPDQETNGNLSSSSHRPSSLRAIDRYLITAIADGSYETENGKIRPEKVLLVRDEKKHLSKTIVLRQSWFDTPCTKDAFVHVIGDFTPHGQCIIDDANNMLILHPDHLISSTVVADSFSCVRRAVLQDRVKATNEASEPQIYGHILHEIFQEALRANRWDDEWLGEVIEKVVLRYIEGIYEVNLQLDQAVHFLQSKMPLLRNWAQIFVSAQPKAGLPFPTFRILTCRADHRQQAGAVVKDRNGRQALMSINKLLDVEEHVWSPKYGLKGNIDATVQVVVDDEDGRKTLTVPFEVKTGKNTTNAAHRAQTALYTLLLSDRYDVEVGYGILYYMETSQVSRIPAIRHEIRHMVMQRNELACYIRDRSKLPDMLKKSHMCIRCYAKTPCFIYHKLAEDGTGATSALGEKFEEAVKHLKPEHQTFFQHWDALLTKEESDMLKFRRELWTMLSVAREKLGRCFANVIIEPGSAQEIVHASKINRYGYTLLKQRPTPGFSFADSQIAVGEPIVISDEKGHFALANGYVTNVRKRKITVAVDRRLHNARTKRKGFDAEKNQVFAGIMEIAGEGAESSTLTPQESDEQTLYRLDKDEFNNGLATVRNNLIQIMANEVIGSREIRSLVVECKAPRFKSTSSGCALPERSSQAILNVDQKQAIEKVMTAKDYALVLGMPGTGKTTTIAHIIRALVSQNKSVLLTSYTHTAVDNILLKIRDDEIGILRLGALAKINPEVQKFVTLASVPKTSVEELREAYHGPKVVATTCLGVNHPIFNERTFDYCIVDEASQITLPVCLGPIRMAKTFVLVGDHNQLPPLVQNVAAREGGLDISLFKLLSEKHPESVVNLEHQYRMCEDIMTLSNSLIYNGSLKCGNDAVAHRSLSIPNIEGLKAHHFNSLDGSVKSLSPSQRTICPRPYTGSCWLRELINPSTRACFINTDPLLPSSREIAKGSRIVNPVEAALCAQLVDGLLSTGVPASDIGVISVYRSQLTLLKHDMRHRPDVEMHTADRFQGRDKEVVILSLVRSNEAKNIGDLLKDWRRINVAFTRARTKLLVLGSKETLNENPLLKTFLELMNSRRWIYDLPKGALDMHVFSEGDSQGTDSLATHGTSTSRTKTKPSPGEKKTTAASVKVKTGQSPSAKIEAAFDKGTDENVPPPPPPSGKKPTRAPAKGGRVSDRAILGSRPILQDIVNDLS